MTHPTRSRVVELAATGQSTADIAVHLGTRESVVRNLLGDRTPSRNGKGNIPDDERPSPEPGTELRPCVSAPGYSVSADGRVWATRKEPPVMMTPRVNARPGGTPLLRVRLSVGGRVADRYIGQLVAEAWCPERPVGAILGYIDEDRTNNDSRNLCWLDSKSQAVVSDSAFVSLFQQCNSMAEAGDRIGLSTAAVYMRAERLRKRGVPLKQLGHADMPLDELIRLAEESLVR